MWQEALLKLKAQGHGQYRWGGGAVNASVVKDCCFRGSIVLRVRLSDNVVLLQGDTRHEGIFRGSEGEQDVRGALLQVALHVTCDV